MNIGNQNLGNIDKYRFLRNITICQSDFYSAISPFTDTAINSGTSAIGDDALYNKDHPGILKILSSGVADSGRLISTGGGQVTIGGGETFECVFSIDTFTNHTCRMGLHDATTVSDAVDGVYFQFSGSGAIIGKTSNNSSRSSTATITTLTVDTWYRAKLQVNSDATSVSFQIFDMTDTQLGSTLALTTNIPSTNTRRVGPTFISTESVGATADLAHVDLISFYLVGRDFVR